MLSFFFLDKTSMETSRHPANAPRDRVEQVGYAAHMLDVPNDIVNMRSSNSCRKWSGVRWEVKKVPVSRGNGTFR
jgi:hypothetical protein